ncbi:MAG: hypothetical protein ACRC8A_15145 [Microcoleaceae cyanobacterium]
MPRLFTWKGYDNSSNTGGGKSTFCRMFADWVRQELHWLMPPNLEQAKIILMRDKTQGKWFEKWELITRSRL